MVSTHDAHEKTAAVWVWLKALHQKAKDKLVGFTGNVVKLGKDDPRRVIHSLKVGLALTLVSLLYYYKPLYDNFGVAAMWAVMTVVVVFEFSVGATLGKGVNRGIATLAAGVLGVGAYHLASLCGETGEPILLGFFVFLQAAASTFMRFFPKMKARYDYGLLIFILTFSLVTVSGYRDDEIIELAHKRLSTILIGGCTCIIISILVCPVWAGEDLHNLTASNLEKLGNFLEGFGNEYFKASEDDDEEHKSTNILQEYKSVLNSKSIEENLANFARWEPRHGGFRFRHPWKQYLRIGTLIRQCAYRIDALNGHLNSDIQISAEIRNKMGETCKRLSLESSKALKELSLAIKVMREPSYAESHIENSKSSAKNLNALIKLGIWEETNILAVIPVATVASLLMDVVDCIEKIAESVYELASKANFKSTQGQGSKSGESGELKLTKSASKVDGCPHVCITVDSESTTKEIAQNGNSSGKIDG